MALKRRGERACRPTRSCVARFSSNVANSAMRSWHFICGLGLVPSLRAAVAVLAAEEIGAARTISAIRAETWETINGALLASTRHKKIEARKVVRFDSTVTAALMHEPSDSTLLWDAVPRLDAAIADGRRLGRWSCVERPSAGGEDLTRTSDAPAIA